MPGTGTYCPRQSDAALSVGVLECTVASLYPRTLVRYAGTCMFASLQWGRCARCPLPIAQDMGFLVLAVAASPARQSAVQSVPVCPHSGREPWGLRLFRYGETNPVHSSISSYRHHRHTISPKAEPFWGLGNRQSLDLRDFPWVSSFPCLVCLDPSSRLPRVTQPHS